jgi:hypothetical protein
VWIDPVVVPDVAYLSRAVYSFAREKALFEWLRSSRRAVAARRRYFLCQAAFAAAAEAEEDERNDSVYFIR